MQNRLDAAREARAASERQLAEVQAAIATERAARPESVRLYPLRFFVLSFIVRGHHAVAHMPPMIGSTCDGTGTPRCDDEGASRAADGARRVWRV